MKPTILNSQGKPIVLNERESLVANHHEKALNALGYQIDVTTLTTIVKKVSEQKFFEVAPAEYIPVRVGEGSWSANLTTYTSFLLGDDFESGVINTGGKNGRLASTDAGVDSITVPVINWAKEIEWTLFDLQQASKSGNWDLVTEKEKSRKKNWDLGIQKMAFLGSSTLSGVKGLVNLAGVPSANTSVITKPISSMTTAEFKTMLTGLLAAYRASNNYTAMPTHFVIPESDYLGLAAPTSADFPLKSMLEVMEGALKAMTKNPNFQILPLAYANAAQSGLANNRYILLNYDDSSLRMDIPVDYTSTLANSINSFSFQNVGYGQFTGVYAYRPLEILYFDEPA